MVTSAQEGKNEFCFPFLLHTLASVKAAQKTLTDITSFH